jgi:aspartyl-tRNA(Asn)/glutamyl-tRNA(Gln) amidotransferase subunit A
LAADLVQECLDRVDRRDGEIHAFNHVMRDNAIRVAVAVDAKVARGVDTGPLAGVPLAIKDNLCTRGVPTTCSSRILERWAPPYTATVVERLEAAGAILIGKTNLDEFAMGSSTENSANGPTRNPLDIQRVPGGTSGGSAAAVAAGFALGALGSDTGGSVRQPASFCGLVGVRPTYGLVSRHGLVAHASSLDQVGPLTRTVGDAATLLEIIAGHDALDSTSIPHPAPTIAAALTRGVEGLRIGRITNLPEASEPAVQASLELAYRTLEGEGAAIVDVEVPAFSLSMTAYYVLSASEASSNLARFDGVRYGQRVDADTTERMMTATRTALFGDEVKRRIMLGTFALSAGYFDDYYAKALKVRRLIAQDLDTAYETVDAMLTPTSPTVAFRLGEKLSDPYSMWLSDIYTLVSPLAGHPAMSVPFGVGESGLPIGVQVLSPARRESTMFRAAAALESHATGSR